MTDQLSPKGIRVFHVLGQSLLHYKRKDMHKYNSTKVIIFEDYKKHITKLLSDIPCPKLNGKLILECECKMCKSLKERYLK